MNVPGGPGPTGTEAEHTNNMIFCLVDLGDKNVVEEIKELKKDSTPDIVVIDATAKKSASVI